MALSYAQWNAILLKYYFNEDMAGKEVIIFADRDTLDHIGSTNREGYEEFVRTLRDSPQLTKRMGICQKALSVAKDWRQTGSEYPPYFAYLVLFVSAATIGGDDFDAKAYYPRLRRVLGEPETTGQYPSFDKMDDLWTDLERWSVEDRHESLGRFTKRVRGGKTHIGIPISQVIISEKERKMLSQFFLDEEFDPADPPSEDVLIKKLAIWGKRNLSKRTLNLISSTDEPLEGLRSAITELVMIELQDWDGTYIDHGSAGASESEGIHKKQAITGAHICLSVDLFGSVVNPSLRIKANRIFPDGGISFNFNGKMLNCRGSGIEGWSTKLEEQSGSVTQIFNPTELDWSNNYSFKDNDESWVSRFRGLPIRIFLPGMNEGLPEWVELQRVIPGTEYLICCHNSVSSDISSWGIESNNSFKQLKLQGLPKDWEIYSASGIKKSYPGSDALSLPRTLIFHVKGGIRIGRGNQYLVIAPPKVIVDSGLEEAKIFLNNSQLQPNRDQRNVYSLPNTAPLDTPLVIELRKNDDTIIQKRTIYLTSPETPTLPQKTILRDKFGKIIESLTYNTDDVGIFGAIPRGIIIKRTEVLQVPTYLSHRIIFIGRFVGQVVEWPDEDLPRSWYPVWAVAKIDRNKWHAYFCDLSGENDLTPRKNKEIVKQKDKKRWKKVLYIMRKVVEPPKFSRYQALWREYRRFAEHV